MEFMNQIKYTLMGNETEPNLWQSHFRYIKKELKEFCSN